MRSTSPAWLPAATHRKTKVPPAPRPSTSLGLKEIFPTTVSCSARGEEGGVSGSHHCPAQPCAASPFLPPSTPSLVPDCTGPVPGAARTVCAWTSHLTVCPWFSHLQGSADQHRLCNVHGPQLSLFPSMWQLCSLPAGLHVGLSVQPAFSFQPAHLLPFLSEPLLVLWVPPGHSAPPPRLSQGIPSYPGARA